MILIETQDQRCLSTDAQEWMKIEMSLEDTIGERTLMMTSPGDQNQASIQTETDLPTIDPMIDIPTELMIDPLMLQATADGMTSPLQPDRTHPRLQTQVGEPAQSITPQK
jgi:hypothetical protein